MKIKRTLQQRANQVRPSEDLFNKIRIDIYEKENKEKMNHKKFSFKNKKLLITAALCIAVTSITVIGAGLGKSWVGHTNIQYMTFPSETKVQEDVGFTPKYTEELPGGFTYKMGGTGTTELKDEIQNVIGF